MLRTYAGPADDTAIGRVRRAVLAADGDGWLPGPDDDEGPPQACGIAEVDGEVVGFTWLRHWTEADGTELYLVLGCVDPAHRGRGAGSALLGRQEAYAASLAAGSDRAVLGANAGEHRPDARQLLLDHGYRVAFTVVQLSRAVADPVAPAVLPDGLQIRPVLDAHQPMIHAAITECFDDAGQGMMPVPYDGYLADVRDTELWVVAWAGDEVAGLVTAERRDDGSVDSPWVAVRPAYRRRGLGRALMARMLAGLRAHGVATAVITTHAENPHGSVALYEQAGYRVVDRQPRYRKPMPPLSR